MNRASQETAIGTEKTAGMGMLIGKCAMRKYLPLVLIYAGRKCRTGGNRFTGKLEGPDLVIDNNIVTEIHAAGSAFPAGKSHIYSPFAIPENLHGIGRYVLRQSYVFIGSH